MSATQNTPPAPMPKAPDKISSAAMRTMRIAHILETETDQDHYLTADEIVEKVENPSDPRLPAVSAERKSVYRNVDALRAMGIKIDGRRKKGYAQIIRRYPPEHIRLLVNAVRCSQVLTANQVRNLSELLCGLASPSQRERCLPGGTHPAPIEVGEALELDGFLETFETVQDAIARNLAISFQLRDYTVRGRAVTRDQARRYVAIPSRITFVRGHYLVCCHYEDDATENVAYGAFRLDHMLRIELVDREGLTGPLADILHVKPPCKTGTPHGNTDNDVIRDEDDTGSVVETHLSVAQPCVRHVIDRFGKPTKGKGPEFLTPFDEDRAHIVVQTHTCPSFYAWVARFAGDIKIVEPQAVAQGYADHLEHAASSA